MPIKKKKISELNEASDFKGFYAIGYRLLDGVKESVKIGLEYIQTAYEKVVQATKDAVTATTDMRQVEATVESNEEARQTAESQRAAAEQGRQTAESARSTAENERMGAETVRLSAEGQRGVMEEERRMAETNRMAAEQLRGAAEKERQVGEAGRQAAEERRVETSKEAVDNANAVIDRLNILSEHRDEIRDSYWWHWDEATGEYENTGELAKGNVMFASFDLDPATGELSCTTDEEYTGASFSVENGDLLVTI